MQPCVAERLFLLRRHQGNAIMTISPDCLRWYQDILQEAVPFNRMGPHVPNGPALAVHILNAALRQDDVLPLQCALLGELHVVNIAEWAVMGAESPPVQALVVAGV
jgi:hypothetical protein